MVGFVPKEMFFTKGVGKHREKLTSFELALRSAGIAACNLVRVSSIFPPKCRILSRAQGMKLLEPGQVTFVVMSEAATREPHRLIAATVGVAIPRDRDTVRLPVGASQLRRERRHRGRLRRGARRRDARDHAWPRVRSRQELGRKEGSATGCRTRSSAPRTSRRPPSADKKGLWTTVVAAAGARRIARAPPVALDRSPSQGHKGEQRTQRVTVGACT